MAEAGGGPEAEGQAKVPLLQRRYTRRQVLKAAAIETAVVGGAELSPLRPVRRLINWFTGSGKSSLVGSEPVLPDKTPDQSTVTATAPATETVVPTPTATEPPKPTSTPTERPATNTPEPTKTPENLASKWQIEVDGGVKGVSKGGVSVEQDILLMQQMLANFPKIGDVKVRLVPGSAGRAGTDYIEIGRELSADAIAYTTAFEIAHVYDVANNEVFLAKHLKPAQIAQLKTLREQALEDPVWGRDYPDLARMLTPAKTDLGINFGKGYSPAQVAQLSNLYPDGIWLGRRFDSGEPSLPIWEKLMPETYKKLDSYQKDNEGVTGLVTISDFLKIPNVAARVAELSKFDPLFAKAIEQINKDVDSFKLDNVKWNSAPAPIMTASGAFTGWYSLRNFVLDAVLSEAYLNGQPDVVKLVAATGKKTQLDSDLASMKTGADKEKLSGIIAAGTSFKVATSADKYMAALKSSASN